nr:hypothetical protein [Bacteroidota bacterium]
MKKKVLTFALTCLISVSFSQKTWVPLKGTAPCQPEITVSHSDQNLLILDILINGIWLEKVQKDGHTFDRISVGDNQTTMEIGRPELPMINEIVGIPDNCNIKAVLLDQETINLGEHLIFPFQTPTTDDLQGYMQEFVYDRGFYQRTNVYPEKVICTDNPEIWRDV